MKNKMKNRTPKGYWDQLILAGHQNRLRRSERIRSGFAQTMNAHKSEVE